MEHENRQDKIHTKGFDMGTYGDNIIDYQPIEKYGELRLLKTVGGIPTGEYIVRPKLLMLEKAGVRERCKKWILEDWAFDVEVISVK